MSNHQFLDHFPPCSPLENFESDELEVVSSAAPSTAEETLRQGVRSHFLISSLHSSITLGVRKKITRFRKPWIVWGDRGYGAKTGGYPKGGRGDNGERGYGGQGMQETGGQGIRRTRDTGYKGYGGQGIRGKNRGIPKEGKEEGRKKT